MANYRDLRELKKRTDKCFTRETLAGVYEEMGLPPNAYDSFEKEPDRTRKAVSDFIGQYRKYGRRRFLAGVTAGIILSMAGGFIYTHIHDGQERPAKASQEKREVMDPKKFRKLNTIPDGAEVLKEPAWTDYGSPAITDDI